MRRHGMGMRMIAIVTLAAFVAGCTTMLPERMATPEEAFPSATLQTISTEAPQGSKKKTLFDAPYEDVWRAVTVATTQAQWNVESAQKAKGLLLATKVTSPKPGDRSKRNTYTYAALVKEVGPKSTEVTVMGKIQSECEYTTPTGIILKIIIVIGIGVALVELLMHNPNCTEASTLRWADNVEDLNQVVVFTRNNLIAAGAL